MADAPTIARAVATAVLWAALGVGTLPAALYTALLTLAAVAGRAPRYGDGPGRRRFAIVIPAHNEEATIGRALASVARLDYPRHLVDTWVVADNCTDATTGIARAAGARVRERRDPVRIGKGYALAWLLERIAAEGERYDAFLILDADSTLSPNFLRAMDGCLEAGAGVAQGYYTVLPLHSTRAEALRGAALALVHYLRPAGKARIGASCGLKGNGMCFAAPVLERYGWPCAGLTEDIEFGLLLARDGVRVAFVPEAVVRGEMPATLRDAAGQNRRWEAGRLAAVRAALPLLARGLRRRNRIAIDAAVEQLVPPLSLPVALALLALLGGRALHVPLLMVSAAGALAAFGLYIVVGLLLARATRREWEALALAPLYVCWKVVLYLRVLLGPRPRAWVRTRRGT
jgi:1,2-diacylglycerol 3-beta-glucosyltransferase